jgi:hypothetical protein
MAPIPLPLRPSRLSATWPSRYQNIEHQLSPTGGQYRSYTVFGHIYRQDYSTIAIFALSLPAEICTTFRHYLTCEIVAVNTNGKPAVTGCFEISRSTMQNLVLVLHWYRHVAYCSVKRLSSSRKSSSVLRILVTLHGDVLFHWRKYGAHQDDVPETARLLMPARGEATLETATPILRHSY